jgi:hypothetical protein
MAILKNCEIWFIKVDPARPNAKFDKANPTWEVQIRTTSKEVKKQWEALGLPVKTMDPDEGPIYYRVNLKKRQFKEDGTPSSFVEVIDGAKQPVDPNTIGNGSVAHIRIFQYDYTTDKGTKGVASILMGMQLIKHIKYVPRPREDEFGEEKTETVDPDAAEGEPFDADTDTSTDDSGDTNTY